MTRNRELAPLLTRVTLLSAGAIMSFGVMVWAAAQGAPSSVEAGPQAALADEAEQPDDPTVLDDEGRFTGPGEVWPPQPKDATDIVERTDIGLSVLAGDDNILERLDEAAGAERAPSEVLASDEAVIEALGDRHNLIAAEAAADGVTRYVYYSLSSNQTVDVTVTGDSVSELLLIAPDEFQPELSQAEKDQAVELARAHWEDRRDRRIGSLQGYSILTFKPDGSYHDTRMVYVSFHVDEDSRPELLAWVDLATGEVVRSEVDR